MKHLIKTERLVLQPMSEADIDFMQELIASPEAYFHDPQMQETPDDIIKDCEWFIEKAGFLPDEGGIRWIIKLDRVSIGEVFVQCNWERTLEWEFGYHFLKEHWGKGYATEALNVIIPYVFTNFKVNRLVAFTNGNNKESIALLKRVGMVEEARLREVRMSNGIYCDEMVYSLLKREFTPSRYESGSVNQLELLADNLSLKTVIDDDIDEVARMWKFEQGSISLADAKEAIEYMQNNHKQNHVGFIYHLCFAIYEKGKNSIIGWCGLDGKPDPENPDRMEIFYLIDSAYRNKGYATQCALKLLEYAFEVAKISHVFGGCDKENISSFKVLSKSGMSLFEIRDNGDPKFFIDRSIYEKLKTLRGGNKNA